MEAAIVAQSLASGVWDVGIKVVVWDVGKKDPKPHTVSRFGLAVRR